MHIVLWVLQVGLAVKLVSVAYSHGIRSDRLDLQRGRERFGAATRWLMITIALTAFLVAAGLVAPAATGMLSGLTAWTAALLGLLMVAAAGLHRACRDHPNTMVSVVLAALASFVAYGRWVIAPL